LYLNVSFKLLITNLKEQIRYGESKRYSFKFDKVNLIMSYLIINFLLTRLEHQRLRKYLITILTLGNFAHKVFPRRRRDREQFHINIKPSVFRGSQPATSPPLTVWFNQAQPFSRLLAALYGTQKAISPSFQTCWTSSGSIIFD